jgi:tripartite-type tricarboxylate transporter receptor subunit TctC
MVQASFLEKQRMQSHLKLVALATAGIILSGLPAQADAVSDFYKGKRMEMLIGYSSGGGYDTYARMIARHWPSQIPGKPRMIPRNVPGAGSMRLMNELYNIRAKDGTAVGTVSRGIVQEELWGTKGVKFKSSEMTWIGSANDEVSVCVTWHTAGIKSFDDMLNKEVIVGGTGPGADTDTFPQVLNNVLGAKLKLVTGYPGGNDINLAMERGEVQGRCGWSWSSVVSTRANWLKEKKIDVILQMSMNKHPDLKDTPLIMDMARDARTRKILELIFARQTMGRPFVAPPKVPADRANMLRQSFMATLKSPVFTKEAERAKLEIMPIGGDAVQKVVADMFAAPKDIIEASRVAALDRSKIKIEKAKVTIIKVNGKLEKLGAGAREVTIAGKKFGVSGSRTKITVGGQKATRKALKLGMNCAAEGTAEAKKIDCK